MSSNDIKDYYYILGLPKNASKDEIEGAYSKLSTKFHPDQNRGDKFFEERFKDIHEAYETLVDDAKRKIYDDRLNANRDTTSSPGIRSAATPPPPPIPKKKRTGLYTTIGGLVILLLVVTKFVVSMNNEEEKVEKFKALFQDTTKHTPVKPDDSVILLRVYYDTTDDDGLTAQDAINSFFSALNNSDCNKAWNMTHNDYWVQQGQDWFCSSTAFGGVNKVVVSNISPVTQNSDEAEINVVYYAEDMYNGNKCFKQNIIVQKIAYTDNKRRWRITKMKNNELPVVCNQSQ